MKKTLIILFLISAVMMGVFWYTRFAPSKSAPIADTLLVGTSADFKPMSYKDGDDIVGFDIDVVKEVAQRLNKKIIISDVPFELLIPQLQLGSIHVIAAGMTNTPQRAEHVIFTEPYLTGDPFIIVSSMRRPLTFAEFPGKQIIVNQGYTADFYLSKRGDITLIRLPTVADAMLALHSGRGDAFVTASNSIKPYLEQYGKEQFALHEMPEVHEDVSMAISQQHPELAEQIKTIIASMLADGTIDALKEKWHIQ